MHIRTAARVLVRVGVAFVAFMVLGNVGIFAFSTWARASVPGSQLSLPGVHNLRAVDARVWRGAAPTHEGYEALAGNGVTTIVDLRAEHGLDADIQAASELGMEVIRVPIRDGQIPGPDEVARFLAAIDRAPGIVFVHCGAGVGRTGTMAASYLVARHGASPLAALRHNLSVGPPSLEQMTYVAGLNRGSHRPDPLVTTVSRVLDAPRRLLSRL